MIIRHHEIKLRDDASREPLAAIRSLATQHPGFAGPLRHIADNLFDPDLKVATLRTALRLTDNNWSLAFRTAVGLYPAALIRNARLETAAALLTSTDLRCHRIAHLVGYTTASFTLAFPRIYGDTPAAYRRHHAESAPTASSPSKPPTVRVLTAYLAGDLSPDDAADLATDLRTRYPDSFERALTA